MLLVYFNGQLILNHLMRRLDVQMVEFSPFLAGVISIGLLFGAYLCEAFCDVRKNLPKQQIESAMALGFSPTSLCPLIYYDAEF
jgi:arginine/ornithine transport system permease protein